MLDKGLHRTTCAGTSQPPNEMAGGHPFDTPVAVVGLMARKVHFRKVHFRIVRKHPVSEPLDVEDGWRVSRVEEINTGQLKVILVRDPGAT